MVILVTDGFFEWANTSGKCFGFPRLHETICAFHSLSCEQIIARLYDRVLAFSGGTTEADDLTAVIIKRKPG